jgi:hypothetical protein
MRNDIMVKYENHCCGCATDSYPCLGSSCELRSVRILICDKCGDEVERLYIGNHNAELCEDCYLEEADYIF